MPQIQSADLRSNAPVVLKVIARELPLRAINPSATVPDQTAGCGGAGAAAVAGVVCASSKASRAYRGIAVLWLEGAAHRCDGVCFTRTMDGDTPRRGRGASS